MKAPSRRSPIALAAIASLVSILVPSFSLAQSPPSVDEVVVTASPLRRKADDVATPVTVLSGEALRNRQASSLGDTLSREPGVNSSSYAPGASRPVIRGQDADHIRVLQNGIGTIDASNVSPDHDVAIDPLTAKRIEILRGPAALLYGPTAVGGVVNVIDGRIPSVRAPSLLAAVIEARGDSPAEGRSVAGSFEGGQGNLAFSLHAFGRDSEDLRIPGFARSRRLREREPLDDDEVESRNRLANSTTESNGGGGGLSWIWDGGYFGVAPSVYNRTYGVVFDDEVTIELEQRRLDFAGGLFSPIRGIESLNFRMGLADYEHTEFEGDEVGTVFENRGYEARVEVVHEPFGPLTGAVGYQSQRSRFSALGEEAFVPRSRTFVNSFFVFEEIPLDPVTVQLGGRFDHQDVEADADDRFGPRRSESFATGSGSIAVLGSPFDGHVLALAFAYTSRPPTATELYANGVHVATGAFELGDPDLGVERSGSVDLSFRRTIGRVTGSVGGYYVRFHDYVTLVPTGDVFEDEEEDHDDHEEEEHGEDEHGHGHFDGPIPVFAYRGLGAEFFGMEAEATVRVLEHAAHAVDVEMRSDYVHARDRRSGRALPRISPFRFGGGVAYGFDRFRSRVDVFHVRKQDRIAMNELPTDGYVMLDVGGGYSWPIARSELELWVRGTNLLDEEARNHVSFLKDLAPLGGRGVAGGMRLVF